MRRQWSYASVMVVALATMFTSVWAADSPTSSDPPAAAAARNIDLRIPPITSIYTPEQIASSPEWHPVIEQARAQTFAYRHVNDRRANARLRPSFASATMTRSARS